MRFGHNPWRPAGMVTPVSPAETEFLHA